MSFDVAAFDTRARSESGVDFPVLHPKSGIPWLDAHGKPITIRLLGRNSETLRSIQRVAAQRDVDRSARGITKTEEDFEAERYDTLVAMTKAWSFDMVDGKPFHCTPENIRKFWSDKRWSWLHFQMMNNLMGEGNFLSPMAPVSYGGPSTSSD